MVVVAAAAAAAVCERTSMCVWWRITMQHLSSLLVGFVMILVCPDFRRMVRGRQCIHDKSKSIMANSTMHNRYIYI